LNILVYVISFICLVKNLGGFREGLNESIFGPKDICLFCMWDGLSARVKAKSVTNILPLSVLELVLC